LVILALVRPGTFWSHGGSFATALTTLESARVYRRLWCVPPQGLGCSEFDCPARRPVPQPRRPSRQRAGPDSHNFSHTPQNNQKRHATPGNRFPRIFRGFLNDSDQSVYVGNLLRETQPPPSAPVSSLQERLLAQQSSPPLAALLECAQHPAREHEFITRTSSLCSHDPDRAPQRER